MAVNVRDPGSLPNVFARVERARVLLSGRKLDGDVREIVESLVALASTQHELNKRLWESKKGSPEPHAETHKAGDDDLTGAQLPEPIEIGDVGDIGDGGLGFAPIDHEHPVDLSVPQIKEVELDFGSFAVVEKVFTVVDAQVDPTSRIVMTHSGEAATGKQADEAEFDAIDCRCEPFAGGFRVYATSLLGHIYGLFRFNYVLSTP
jgi:hypothetical protein